MKQTGPRLREGDVELVPVGPEHYQFLRHHEFTRLGHWWRSRGTLASPEEFASRIWAGVATQCVAIGVSDERPLLWLQCFNLDRENDIASLAVARLSDVLLSRRPATALALFVEYCFTEFALRKLYVEMAEPNAVRIGSTVGPLLVEEARFADHLRVRDQYFDLIISAIWRDFWFDSALRKRLLPE